MPLRDHFHPPVGTLWHWASIHGAWITFLMQQLNLKLLPAGYYAQQHVHLGGQVQIDVATLQNEAESLQTEGGNGGVATAVWAPPQPPLVVPVDFADLDIFEVRVLEEKEGQHLVAAIELVSPANKDRLDHRTAFAAKCAAYLQQGIGLIVVDVVTERHDNLHDELMGLLQLDESGNTTMPSLLYVVAYRAVGWEAPLRLEMWPTPLTVGGPLPVLPLWIAKDRAVPLDLEASYTLACESSRIR